MGEEAHNRRETALEQRLFEQLRNRKRHSKLRQLKSSPAGSVDFSSNDFLSLATNSEFRDDFMKELQKNMQPVGSTGSRLLDGNSSYAESLEKDIASFHGAEAGLLTNSGFDANVSIFMCLPQQEDIIVYDELIHASVHDGMRQSRAQEAVSFKHNSVKHLKKVLMPYTAINTSRNIFVAVESVYSMDGDLAPLAEIVSLVERLFPAGNCHLIVDEAHATGVYGPKGRGRVSELQLEKKILIRLNTFGKALACNGGEKLSKLARDHKTDHGEAIILCSEVIKLYLINYARPLIYTTFMSYSSLTAIKVAYDWLQAGKTEPLAHNLFNLITHLHQSLQNLTRQTLICPSVLTVPIVCPDSPIFALVSTQPRALAAHCQAAGFVVRAVVPPTVPEGTERVRVCLHAGNTVAQIDDFVGCVRRWVQQQSVPSESNRVSTSSIARRSSPIERNVGGSVDRGMMSGSKAKL